MTINTDYPIPLPPGAFVHVPDVLPEPVSLFLVDLAHALTSGARFRYTNSGGLVHVRPDDVQDNPEGSCVLLISDTLARHWAREALRLACTGPRFPGYALEVRPMTMHEIEHATRTPFGIACASGRDREPVMVRRLDGTGLELGIAVGEFEPGIVLVEVNPERGS